MRDEQIHFCRPATADSYSCTCFTAVSVEQRMKFRDHPLTVYKGLRSWPPIWVCMGNSSTRVLTVDEDGILTRVTFHALGENKIALHANNEGGKYRAHIYFDDDDFCLQVYERLKDYVSKPIKDVGDMEIEPVGPPQKS